MLKMKEDKVQELTVSDPIRKLSRVMLTLSGTYDAQGDHFFTIPDTHQDNTLIIVDLPVGVYAGKSINVKFN